MQAALIIIAALVVVGLPLYLYDRYGGHRGSGGAAGAASGGAAGAASGGAAGAASGGAAKAASGDVEEGCCGMHITCEKDSLLAGVITEIIYYDDEELDAYKGREADQYTDEEIEQFRDVLLTLLPSDIAGWGRSLQLRGINLPQDVRDELLMIVAEARKV